nr:very-long-chain 3-oxoacyl-CoA reductase-like [Loxodonta africana]
MVRAGQGLIGGAPREGTGTGAGWGQGRNRGGTGLQLWVWLGLAPSPPERLHGTLTRVIQADFTGGLEIYGAIEEGLKGLEIGVLVNNVGMLYDEGFWKMLDVEDPAKRLSDIVNCNMMSVLQMTRIILPQMVSRRRGIIINVSSLSESRPNPFLAVYSATKVFVRNFSLAVAAEYLSEGVIVQTVSPAVVSTNMNRRLQTGLLVESPEDWARQAVHTLGLSSHTSGCLSHAVQVTSWGLHRQRTGGTFPGLSPLILRRRERPPPWAGVEGKG